MLPKTQALWQKQDQHKGDRLRLFGAVGQSVTASSVLYPGCYVDVAPSFVFPDVTYVDVDKRANAFFADTDGVHQIVTANAGVDENAGVDANSRPRSFSFLHEDYRNDLDLQDESFDMLISLYAGFISQACTRYLRVGGTLLVNPSHGDAAMASIDARYELRGVVTSRDSKYKVDERDLDQYLVPKKQQKITPERLHELGRGIAYTKSPFAYLFRRVS